MTGSQREKDMKEDLVPYKVFFIPLILTKGRTKGTLPMFMLLWSETNKAKQMGEIMEYNLEKFKKMLCSCKLQRKDVGDRISVADLRQNQKHVDSKGKHKDLVSVLGFKG